HLPVDTEAAPSQRLDELGTHEPAIDAARLYLFADSDEPAVPVRLHGHGIGEAETDSVALAGHLTKGIREGIEETGVVDLSLHAGHGLLYEVLHLRLTARIEPDEGRAEIRSARIKNDDRLAQGDILRRRHIRGDHFKTAALAFEP